MSDDTASQDEPLMTSGEASKYLRLSRDTFNRRVRDGKIKFVEDIASEWRRFRKSDLDAYLEEWKSLRLNKKPYGKADTGVKTDG